MSMRELSDEGEAAGERPLQQVLLHALNGLQIVLQEPSVTIQGGDGEQWTRTRKKETDSFKDHR